MSRIGKKPVTIPAGVTITVSKESEITVKGPKGELKQLIDLIKDLDFIEA